MQNAIKHFLLQNSTKYRNIKDSISNYFFEWDFEKNTQNNKVENEKEFFCKAVGLLPVLTENP